ncbi:hypothetical protein G7Z17_g12338 [Cylindrodendrum hubeiense]|uniref:Uncharacterized protein n=1 Tax=Cylindrodendrum hubeiense TaxID=595255 RepID=A0A9P5H398_9HYPO|nr:hypothetical protein G7Z17_g12338 [Cylindrodendrum hubeiense]
MSLNVQKLAIFDPPGYPEVDDGLTDSQKLAWSQKISRWMDSEIAGKPGQFGRTKLPQFFNGTVTAYDVAQQPAAITWIGFPNLRDYPNAPRRWEEADSTRNNQDEYLEWSVKKNGDGNIETVTFTCEGPEYWEFLAKNEPDKLNSLYLDMNPGFKDQMDPSDWWNGNRYNAQNKWNDSTTTGTIAHLVQPNNTLSAEVDIAAQGTVIRKDKNGKIITDQTKLINCSGYGQPQRNSDPVIGSTINALARKGSSVSIANPIALYIHHFSTSNFQLDVQGTGEDMIDVPDGTFNWQRGDIDKNMGLRLQVKIPDGIVGEGPDNKGRQLTVSDIVDNKTNNNILYGAQFADYITMTVKGVTIAGGKPADPLPCPGLQSRAESGFSALAADATPCDASTAEHTPGTRL